MSGPPAEATTVGIDDYFSFVRTRLATFELQTAPPERVAPLMLSERSARFLTEVGLPTRDWLPELTCTLAGTLPTPEEHFGSRRFAFHESWRETRLLGDNFGAVLYIDSADGGSVWHFDLGNRSDAFFVNSRVELLGLFIATWVAQLGGTADLSDVRLWAALEEKLAAIDPEALEATSFWPLVIEDQMMLAGADYSMLHSSPPRQD